MKLTILFLCLLFLMGCSSMQQMNEGTAPKLLIQSPLPPFPETLTRPVFEKAVETLHGIRLHYPRSDNGVLLRLGWIINR